MAEKIVHKYKAGDRLVSNPDLDHIRSWDADRIFVIASRINETNSRGIPLYRVMGDRGKWSEEWFVRIPTDKASVKRDTITQIAQKHLGIDTLESRKSDSLDFHELSVWNIKAALEAAYKAGQEAGE